MNDRHSGPSRWMSISSPRSILILLAAINLVNYLDRQVIFTLNTTIKEVFHLGDMQIGLLGSAFVLGFVAASLPLGMLADRWKRKWVIALGVGVWSLATALSAAAQSFGMLFSFRAIVGIGEAAYAPAASAMISERYPKETRARAIGVFNLGMLLGGGAGMALGGMGSSLGWKLPFLIVGIPGLFLAFIAAAVHEERRRVGGEWLRPLEVPDMEIVFRRPALLAVYAGGTLISFFAWGFQYWMPHFMKRYHGFEPQSAGLFMALAVVGAGGGVWFGSWLADRLIRTRRDARLLVSAWGMIIALPIVALSLLTESVPVMLSCLVGVAFFAVWFTAPLLAAICDLVEEKRRATFTSIYFLSIQLLGAGLATTLLGALSDRFSLRSALLATLVMPVFGTLWLLHGARAIRRERIPE